MARARKRKDRENQHRFASTTHNHHCSNGHKPHNGHADPKVRKSGSIENSSSDSDRLFPGWTPYAVWVLVTAVRVLYVRQPDNWWTLHPDENFQSMEVAHTQVYGYGFRPYEFSSLSHDGVGGAGSDGVSLYRQRELQLGMHGMRSALYPNFYVIVSWVFALFSRDVRPFVLWKTAHAVISSLLPLSVYRFSNVYFRSHDASCLAAILVAMSTHLNVLGTHPLLNSFLSPIVFWALSCIYPLISGCSLRHGISSSEDSSVKKRNSTVENGNVFVSASTNIGFLELKSSGENTLKNAPDCNGNFGMPNSCCLPLNGTTKQLNGTAGREYHSITTHQDYEQRESLNLRQKPAKSNTKHNGSAGFRVFHNLLPNPAKNTSRSVKVVEILNFSSAFALALCVYMRVDVALFATVILLPAFRSHDARYRSLVVSAFGVLLGIGFSVLQDYLFYDELVLSPGNWAVFNVFRDLSGDFFGKSSFSKYFRLLFRSGVALPVLVLLNAIVLLYIFVQRVINCFFSNNMTNGNSSGVPYHSLQNGKNFQINGKLSSDSSNQVNTRDDCSSNNQPETTAGDAQTTSSAVMKFTPAVGLTLSWIVLLLFYSSKEHKELRFIHNVIVLMLITSAYVLTVTMKKVTKLNDGQIRIVSVVVISLFALDQWSFFPNSRDQSNQSWAYQRISDSHDLNACLNYLGAQSDVTGVFMDRNFHVTAGYALFHHDVPLITLLVDEFVEFDSDAKINLTKPSLLDKSKNISYVTIDRLSNFVSVQNAGYVVKLLIQKERYNYVVVGRDRKFLAIGFREVYTHGTMRVMKRTYNPEQEKQLKEMTAKSPLGINATVLNYEGDVLYRFHRFHLALERYQAALQLDHGRAHTFQAIAACRLKLGDQSDANKWIQACTERFGVNECDRPLGITNINPGRRLF